MKAITYVNSQCDSLTVELKGSLLKFTTGHICPALFKLGPLSLSQDTNKKQIEILLNHLPGHFIFLSYLYEFLKEEKEEKDISTELINKSAIQRVEKYFEKYENKVDLFKRLLKLIYKPSPEPP